MKDRYLFKAKEKNWKELPEDNRWVVGYLVKYPTGEWKIERECDNPPDGDPMWRRVNIIYEVDPSTICQCTGLKDKNSKLIWENDIAKVRYSDGQEEISQVSWNEYGYYPWMNEYQCDGCDLSCEISDIEVIGNIFDNPELLEV